MSNNYVPERTRLRNNLRAVIDAYCDFTGYRRSTVLQRVLYSNAAAIILRNPSADIKAGKYDAWVTAFARVWPAGLAWPEGVPRPPVEPEAGPLN